jgi:hypothetical protein
MWSSQSDLQGWAAGQKKSRPFKPISYIVEKRQGASQDVLRHYQRVMRIHRAHVYAITEEKADIVASMKREKAHIESLNQESERRQNWIRDTLEFLRNASGKREMEGGAPSLSQLKFLSDAILKEALRFKKDSEQPERIEREMEGCKESNPWEMKNPPGENATIEEEIEFQRSRVSALVFKEEEARLKLETIMTNRDMLTRTIFDHETALEAIKVKKQGLQEESERLADEFKDSLEETARKLGELLWKNAMVQSCNEVTKMVRT